MAAVQRERPVANTPDRRRFDDWTRDLVSDLAETLPNDDDRLRLYESLIRAGVWAMYNDHGYWDTHDFMEGFPAALSDQWKEDCAAKRDAESSQGKGSA